MTYERFHCVSTKCNSKTLLLSAENVNNFQSVTARQPELQSVFRGVIVIVSA